MRPCGDLDDEALKACVAHKTNNTLDGDEYGICLISEAVVIRKFRYGSYPTFGRESDSDSGRHTNAQSSIHRRSRSSS